MEEKKVDPEEFLKPDTMIRLYASGAFPMTNSSTGKIEWYLPSQRAIIPLDNFNIPRSARKGIAKLNFEIKYDTDFKAVVLGCADRSSTWISDRLIEAYMHLHKRGYIHTVETWQNGELVGGLYGIAFRGAFFGESMFSRVSQASKAALIGLLQHLQAKGFSLLDVQYFTKHLEMFGAVNISFEMFNEMLIQSYSLACEF